ncbi:MAG: hypothetical protein HYV07_19215 [Deltaproteobacteria bacterium]|nr:hypothetical protein [Deltaproteobacteria bacterium]
MEATDLTVRILQEIRDELRAQREDMRAQREDMRAQREEQQKTNAEFIARFETIETSLRDVAEQLLRAQHLLEDRGHGLSLARSSFESGAVSQLPSPS